MRQRLAFLSEETGLKPYNRLEKLQDFADDAVDEIELLLKLISDVVEDETEFETDWNKAARAALAGKDK